MTENNKKKKMKVEQNDPNGSKLKSKKPDLLCGGMHQISIFRPSVIIDSHMHIQSGNCAPLPFLWGSVPVLGAAKPSRGFIDGAGKTGGYFVDLLKYAGLASTSAVIGPYALSRGLPRKNGLRQMVPEAKKKTIEVGADFIARQKKAYEFFKKEKKYKGLAHLVLSGVVMTMDMEYAHINGYFGIKVYNAVYADEDTSKKPIHYWYPIPGNWKRKGNSYVQEEEKQPLIPEEGHSREEYNRFWKDVQAHEGISGCYQEYHTNKFKRKHIQARPCLTDKKETDRYEQWKKQVAYTEQVVLANPLKMLPLFHYDPRRWQLNGNQEVFTKVDLKDGIYLGFKMYTAQGYRPWDVRRLPIMADFYAECCKRKTPIMNHCTPKGAPTFDKEKYINFVHPNDSDEDMKQKHAKPHNALGATIYDPVEYFNDQFVSPNAWRKVLDATVKGRRLNTLRICLAHFGGNTSLGHVWGRQIIEMMKEKKYPNLYADISSSFANEKFRDYFVKIMKGPDGKYLKSRILFGTDWYLTLLDGVDYIEYCRKAKKALDEFDNSLWFLFTQYNPCRFYRLDEQIERIARNIVKRRKTKMIRDILGPIGQDKIDAIEKEAAYIKQASLPYNNYKEWP